MLLLIHHDVRGVRTTGAHVGPSGNLHMRSGSIRYAKVVYCLVNDAEAVEDNAMSTQSFVFHMQLHFALHLQPYCIQVNAVL